MISRIFRRAYSDLSKLKHTPFYDLHLKYGGKMVDYAGYSMPVLYQKQTHIESHNWVRTNAGLFDVSHMVQHTFKGPDAIQFLEKITPGDIQGLAPFTSTLSVLLNNNGGIVDDTIITRQGEDEFYVVTNAGRRNEDLSFLRKESSGLNVSHEIIGGGLLALQGPKAAENLQKLTNFDLSTLYFGQSQFITVDGIKVHVARGGYTGEDGFEISIPDSAAANVIATKLLGSEDVNLIGLAARDSLRLEAGMCLYGHELSEEIGPVAARLMWTIGKRRRAEANFNGAASVLADITEKKTPLRSGLVSKGPAPRHGAKVLDKEGNVVGEITSGSMSPTLKENVAMAYLPRRLSKIGTELDIEIRGKLRPAVVKKMPFVEPKYYRQP